MGFRIWIDLNSDGDFADANEDAWNSVTTGYSYAGSISVPSGTSPGTKRMRVRAHYLTVPTSSDYCTTLAYYGETEDYSVTVVAPCSAPTSQASTIAISAVGCTQMTVSWTNGNGSNRIVIAKAGSAVTAIPTNNITYNANSVFGNGSMIASNEYVVYNGNSNSVTVTGLTAGVTYYFKVFEYNCAVGAEKYNTTSPPLK